ncbi:HTH-type transcriptional repressor PurR [bioreactor metagenome]|uniref:HTH-type transcriptional repressor PurR n=1 Tax=bioreactor metagenome TaxID=1076179 RepID=A0A645AKE5_9ZZZZ
MKVTIKDVAKEANVAVSTVSRVLSDSSKISEKTKTKVWDAVKKLNYVPNEMARGLANKRTKILAVIIPQWICDSFYHPFFLQVFRGISNCAKDRDYFIMYAFKEDDDTWINRFIQSNFVEGILLFHEEEDKITTEFLKDMEFPFVSVSINQDLENALFFEDEDEKSIHEANGRYLGQYVAKVMMDILESKKTGKKYYIINTKLIEKESLVDKMKSKVLYNRNI